MGNLGIVYEMMGQLERAENCYRQDLDIAREIGDNRGEALCGWDLGVLYEKSNPELAVKLMSFRVDYEYEIGHPDADEHAERVAKIKARLQKSEMTNRV